MSDYTVIGFAGATAFKRRLLDFYATKTGGYVGSYILDGEVRSITAVGNRLAVISEDQVGLFRLDIFRAEPPALERD